MIKLFLAHVCGKTDHILVNWLSEKLAEEKFQFEVFVACQREGGVDDAAAINSHLAESQIFIPVVGDEFKNRRNCISELRQARERKRSSGFPSILPIKYGASEATLEELKLPIHQDTNEGEKYIDFTDGNVWEDDCRILLERIVDFCVKNQLIGANDFYLDIEIINIILKHEKPTALGTRAALEFCKLGEEYRAYFFQNADKKAWLFTLKPYAFFQRAPIALEATDKVGWYKTPRWNVLPYLEKMSKLASLHEDVANELLRILRDVSKSMVGPDGSNNLTSWSFAKILTEIPADKITINDIRLVSIWLNCADKTLVSTQIGKELFPKMLTAKSPGNSDKSATLLECITELFPNPNKGREGFVFAMEGYWLCEFLTIHGVKIGNVCGLPAVDLLKKRLRSLIANDPGIDAYSYIGRNAIEFTPKSFGSDNPIDILICALRDAVIGCLTKDDVDATTTILSLLNDESEIVQRIGIYAINQNFQRLEPTLWDVLTPHRLQNNNFRHEIFSLLETYFKEFPREDQNRILAMIESISITPQEGSDPVKTLAWFQLNWLEAIKNKGNPAVDAFHAKCVEKTGSVPTRPSFASYSETMWGYVAPIESKDLAAKSIPEVVTYLNDFKESKEWKAPSTDGLARNLQDALVSEPDKFARDIALFKNTQPKYQISIFQAFIELWNKKVPIEWKPILEFCHTLTDSPEFWNSLESLPNEMIRDRRGILFQITTLLSVGNRNPDWVMDVSHLPLVEKILCRIIAMCNSTPIDSRDNGDQNSSDTIQSYTLLAILEYALRLQRQSNKQCTDSDIGWQHIGGIMEQEINIADNLPYHAFVGRYLLQIEYLNRQWVRSHFNELFPIDKEREKEWVESMEGYFESATHFHPEIYKLLAANGSIGKALNTNLLSSKILDKVRHIVFTAYLQGLETLENAESLICQILQRWNTAEIGNLIWFVWTLRDGDLTDDNYTRILKFWDWCIAKIGSQVEENREILSDLCQLTAYLTDFQISDDQKKWLIESAPYADFKGHSTFFVEYLNLIANTDPKVVAEIYLAMLSMFAPDFEEENIRSTITKIYEAGHRAMGNDICSAYARHGNVQLLQDIREKYNH